MAKTTEQNDMADKKTDLKAGSLRRMWPVYAAAAFSLIWIAAAVVLLGFARREGLVGPLSAVDIGVFIAALFTPIVTFWMMALVFQRTDPLLERRLAVARTLDHALAPIDAAEHRLDGILSRLTKDLQTLDHTVDLASERITALEHRFKDQLSELFSATTDAENRAKTISDLMQKEREALKGLSSALELQAKDIQSGLEIMISNVEDSGNNSRATMREATDRVAEETERLAQTAQSAAERLERTLIALQDQESSLRISAEQTNETLTQQISSLSGSEESYRDAMDRLGSAIHSMHEAMADDAQSLNRIAETADERGQRIRTVLAEQAESLSQAADDATARTLAAAQGFKDEAAAIEGQAQTTISSISNAGEALNTRMGETVQRLNGALDTLNERLGANIEDIETRLAAMNSRVQEEMQAISAKLSQDQDALHELTGGLNDAANSLTSASTGVQGVLDESTKQLSQKTVELSENIDAANTRLGEIESRIENQNSAFKSLLDTLGDSFTSALEQLTSQSEALQSLGKDHHGAFEGQAQMLQDRLEALRGTLESAVTQISETGQDFSRTAGEITAASEEQTERLDTSLQRLTAQRVQVMEELERLANDLTSACDGAVEKLGQLSVEKGDVSEGLTELSQTLDTQLSKVRETVRIMQDSAQDGAVQVGAAYLNAMARSRKVALEAVEAARGASSDVARVIEDTISQSIARLSESENAHAAALSSRMQDAAEAINSLLHKTLEDVAQAAERTGGAANESAQLLAQQAETLMKHGDELKQRISTIEHRIQDTSKNDLVHSSSLIIEGLNSAAIDINRALSTEVPDETWSSYLAGDKSIFARRTVKLGDRKTRSAIAQRYDSDGEFRENVRHYLKDFELLMSRAMVGTEPSALSITLVSSELGKLYVLLAQSIKRMN